MNLLVDDHGPAEAGRYVPAAYCTGPAKAGHYRLTCDYGLRQKLEGTDESDRCFAVMATWFATEAQGHGVALDAVGLRGRPIGPADKQ